MYIDKEEKTALILLAVVLTVIIAAHFGLSQIDKNDLASPYSQDSQEGELVSLSANVTDIQTTKTGGHLIINTDKITIFVNGGSELYNSIQKDSVISASGILTTYNSSPELSVSKITDIKVIST